MQGLGKDEGEMGDKGEMVLLPKDQIERRQSDSCNTTAFIISDQTSKFLRISVLVLAS